MSRNRRSDFKWYTVTFALWALVLWGILALIR